MWLVGHRSGRGGVLQELIADLVDVDLGAERLLGVDALRPLVDDRALIAVERAAVEVPLDEVLLELGTDRLEQVAHVPEDRIVAQDRVPPLHQVPDADQDEA